MTRCHTVKHLYYYIRRKRSQRANALWCIGLKGNPRENLFYKREREEMGAGTCYFKTYP